MARSSSCAGLWGAGRTGSEPAGSPPGLGSHPHLLSPAGEAGPAEPLPHGYSADDHTQSALWRLRDRGHHAAPRLPRAHEVSKSARCERREPRGETRPQGAVEHTRPSRLEAPPTNNELQPSVSGVRASSSRLGRTAKPASPPEADPIHVVPAVHTACRVCRDPDPARMILLCRPPLTLPTQLAQPAQSPAPEPHPLGLPRNPSPPTQSERPAPHSLRPRLPKPHLWVFRGTLASRTLCGDRLGLCRLLHPRFLSSPAHPTHSIHPPAALVLEVPPANPSGAWTPSSPEPPPHNPAPRSPGTNETYALTYISELNARLRSSG